MHLNFYSRQPFMQDLTKQGKARVKHQPVLSMQLDNEEDTNNMNKTSNLLEQKKTTAHQNSDSLYSKP